MTECPEDKSHDCGRAISGFENFTWNEFLNTLHTTLNASNNISG